MASLKDEAVLFLIDFYGLLSFVFCVSFFLISYLYTVLSLKMMMKARNAHCLFQRVLKPQLPPSPLPLSKVVFTTVGTAPAGLRVVNAEGLVRTVASCLSIWLEGICYLPLISTCTVDSLRINWRHFHCIVLGDCKILNSCL